MTEPTADHATPAAMPARLLDAAESPDQTEPTDTSGLDENDPQLDARTLAELRKNRSENKGLRDRLRSTEADFEAATTALAAMRRAEVQRVAADHLVDPADLWVAHPYVDDFLGDDGTIDPAKVTEAAQGLTAEKPHLAVPKTIPPPSNRPIESLRAGASPDEQPSAPSWAGALRPRISG